jgi:hypothetical protein
MGFNALVEFPKVHGLQSRTRLVLCVNRNAPTSDPERKIVRVRALNKKKKKKEKEGKE